MSSIFDDMGSIAKRSREIAESEAAVKGIAPAEAFAGQNFRAKGLDDHLPQRMPTRTLTGDPDDILIIQSSTKSGAYKQRTDKYALNSPMSRAVAWMKRYEEVNIAHQNYWAKPGVLGTNWPDTITQVMMQSVSDELNLKMIGWSFRKVILHEDYHGSLRYDISIDYFGPTTPMVSCSFAMLWR